MVPIAAVLLLGSCGHYADFTLPPVAGGNPNLTFAFQARPEPVLTRGAGWESHDVLNPSVIRAAPPANLLLNLYSGFDGHAWHTGLAASADGLSWEKRGRILSPDSRTWEGAYWATNGAALSYGGKLWYWYQAGPRERPALALARSSDTHTWTREPIPVLEPGPYKSWDEYGVADPYVLRIEPFFYLYYLGQDRARRQRLGVARSRDGIQWEKLVSNPILELGDAGAFDENGLGEPAVWNSHGFYWMLYTGRDAGEVRRMGLARSTNGVQWQKLPTVFSGAEAWDSKVICDATVLVEGETIRVWFGGGNAAEPERDLNGQIGYGVLVPVLSSGPSAPRATLGK